jgi:hypothetical protein
MSVLVTDNFLGNFDALQAYHGDFEVKENHDGAVYPAVCMEVPREIRQELYRAITNRVGFDITPKYTFLRRFEEGSVEPYQAHTDLNMGRFTCIVYKQGIGGTSFVKHKETGMFANDSEAFDFDVWDRDKNEYDAWDVYYFEQLVPNKSVVYDASLMHRGEPVYGHGVGEEARELLICFFDVSILQRTRDTREILEVLQHPSIWDAIGGNEVDGDWVPDMSDDWHYLHADGAIFILHPEGDDWMIHANVIPEARERAFEMGQEALRYAFEYLGADKVVAEIPEKYDNVYKFSLKSGMEEVDFIDGEHKLALRYDQWVQQEKQLNQ